MEEYPTVMKGVNSFYTVSKSCTVGEEWPSIVGHCIVYEWFLDQIQQSVQTSKDMN